MSSNSTKSASDTFVSLPKNDGQGKSKWSKRDSFCGEEYPTLDSLTRLLSMHSYISPNTIIPSKSKQPPMKILTTNGVQVTMHYTGNRPHPQMMVFLITISNFNEVPISGVQFVAALSRVPFSLANSMLSFSMCFIFILYLLSIGHQRKTFITKWNLVTAILSLEMLKRRNRFNRK